MISVFVVENLVTCTGLQSAQRMKTSDILASVSRGVNYSITYASCPFMVRRIALEFRSNTCTSPSSPPATTSFPSFRISAPLALSLNLVIVFATFPVFGAYTKSRDEVVMANL